jgi:histidyl-tRNA synthetase
VRGLDYYNLTVFEWITDDLGAQGTICGGGRYDPLIAQMGGKPAPACGFAVGAERVIDLLRTQGMAQRGQVEIVASDVYVVHQGDAAGRLAMRVAEGLRTAGLNVVLHSTPDGRPASFRSQMKKADASGAAFAVIFGDEEVAANEASVKLLRSEVEPGGAPQQRVALSQLAERLIDLLVGNSDEDD